MKTKPLVKEFIRFGVVGVLATALHYGIYYFLQSFINVNVAYTTGYVISFIVNFYLTLRSEPLRHGKSWLVWEGRIWLIICCISFC